MNHEHESAADRQRRCLPSPAEIEAGKTPAGGWSRATLASWGVAWPPPAGWKRRLIADYREREAEELDRESAARSE